MYLQVTVIQGDAADDKTIQSLVQRALDEEGRLDVFFANVRTFPCLMRVPDPDWTTGRHRLPRRLSARLYRRRLGTDDARQHDIVLPRYQVRCAGYADRQRW